MPSSTERLYWNPEKPWGHELVANTLSDLGVECVFSLTGDHVAAMLSAFADKGIRVVGTRSEAAAVLAATGYAINSGKTGVVCVTSGMLGFAHAAMLSATGDRRRSWSSRAPRKPSTVRSGRGFRRR